MKRSDATVGSRAYCIRSHEDYFFHAGRTPDQRQVLMGLPGSDLVAFFFDMAGAFLEAQTRRLEFPRSGHVLVDGEEVDGQQATYDIHVERISECLHVWQQEIGFEPGVIRLQKFFMADLGIGVRDYPDHFLEIVADPESSEAERADVRDSMRLWDADGLFVLLWGTEYWLNGEGEVESS